MSDIKYALYTSSKGFKVVGGIAAQFLKADGSVDATSYIPAGTDINMADKNINFTSGSLSRVEGSCRVFNKVFQKFTGNAQTGILSLKFPQATTAATMFDVTLKIYGYQNRFLGNLRIAFYKQSAILIHATGAKAVIECSETFPTTVINAGIDADGKVCINIGEATTFWNTHVTVEVERVVSQYTGYNSDWSKGWSQGIETDTSTYQSLLNIVPDIVASRAWVDANNAGSIPKSASLLSTADLNTFLTPGFYYQHSSTNATSERHYPIGLAGYLNVYRASTTRLVQEYTEHLYGRTWKRVYDGTNFSTWLKVWSENDFNQTNIDTWNAAAVETGNNLKVLGNGVSKHNIWNSDVFTLRNSSAWAISGANRPVNTNSAILNVTPNNPSSGGTYGFSLGARNNRLFFVTEENSVFGSWLEVYHTGNFSPSNYYTKNESLGLFVGLNGVQNISGTKTFTESPIVPNATLNGHAVNFGQMDSLLGQTVSNFIPLGFKGAADGVAELDSNGLVPASQLPALTATLPDSGVTAGNYKSVTVNTKGIVTAGTNPTTLAGYGITNAMSTSHPANNINAVTINKWNMIADQGIRINQGFAFNTGAGLVIADDYFGGDSGIVDNQLNRFLAAKKYEYYFYGSENDTFDGLNFHCERRSFGMGRDVNDTDKLTVEGSVKASKNFKSEDESPDTLFIPNGNTASLRDEIINDESEYAIRLDPHEYVLDSFSSLGIDDRNRLIHIIGEYIKMVVDFKQVYPKQQIVIYNFDQNDGPMEVKIQGKTIYYLEPKSFLRLYVTKSLRVIAERLQSCDVVW